MVLFTSGSSLTWGNLQVLHLASPPGIYPVSTLNNWFLMSLQRLHDDWTCILCQKGREVGEGYNVPMGKSWHLSLPELSGTPMSFLWGTTFHQWSKYLGAHPEALQWHDLSLSLHRRHFGGSELWLIPSMDKSQSSLGTHYGGVVGTLSAYITSRPDWPYALVQLFKGSNHTPLPKGKHLGVQPQGKAGESPYGWISQLEVHQLLSARPQVMYPVGLKGNDEPVMTTSSDLLHSTTSITTNEHLYMRIDIPPPPQEEPEHTTLPVGKVHTIPAANLPKPLQSQESS